ncbi:3-hydroxybutyrate dehydrogenase [Humitalea rosea]|uniref:3-hydroxybutyrate dehydrogenase n=1 Tax=Humitalea rosea TaxID=990373 RepID=A0A2W7I0W8_9PROT|nr:SDR family NAD(P)-dependent oxidoreductase [Humitalea rosea]PZW38905.1 3-hydroxybutyrate dehydrogenase [Humitalea rosea]
MVSLTEIAPETLGLGLRGRTALVTGSTGGIGHAVAARLAAAGCDIVLHGLATEAEGAAAVAEIDRRHAVSIRYHHADLASPAAIEAMVSTLDSVDILVNNAASRHFGPVEQTSTADWEADLAVNLSAAFHLIRLTLPGMRERGWGRIINMSSIFGLIGAAGRVGYVTTKTALIGLTRAVALETAGGGITCNALCPGTTMTPNIEARIRAAMGGGGGRAEAEAGFLAGKQPTGRFVDPAAVGAAVAFLCSPAGGDITGVALPIDGGWSAT